jgi:ribosome biogenesis GTPase
MTDITDYGYLPTLDTDINTVARITAVHKDRFEIVCAHGFTHARLKSSVYFLGKDDPVFPTAGDFVVINYTELGDSQIIKTLPRKSFFSRLDPSSRGYRDQAVAANFNYVFILSSLNRDFNLRRIERYVTLAWNSGGIPVVILTKADLAGDFSEQVRQVEKVASGVGVFAVSAKTGYGLEQLSDYLKPRKTIVFLGSSGVGKSSLVNALAGEEIMKVRGIREDDSKGRHTTTPAS